jgi:hypothetical protein
MAPSGRCSVVARAMSGNRLVRFPVRVVGPAEAWSVRQVEITYVVACALLTDRGGEYVGTCRSGSLQVQRSALGSSARPT